MSEVKYYHVGETGLVEGLSPGRITVVLLSDYAAAVEHIRELELLAGQEMKSTELATSAGLRVVAERDAALEDLRLAKQLQTTTDAIVIMVDGQRDHWIEKHNALQQRLTAADERADVLEGLLRRALAFTSPMPLRRAINAALNPATEGALKPAEGGGDE